MADVDEDILLRVLREEEDDATSYYSSEMADKQTEAMDAYNGKIKNDVLVPNRSQVVTHDIEDTINWIKPHLKRVFTGRDVISCEDDGAIEDDGSLDVAAKFITHVFFKDNPGETILDDFLFDGLLQKVGVARAYWEDPKPTPPNVLQGIPLDIVAKYIADPRYEILEAELDGDTGETPPQMALPSPSPQQPQAMPSPQGGGGLMNGMAQQPIPLQPQMDFRTATIKVQKVNQIGRACVDAVPPEEFRVSRRAKSLEAADYHAWKHEVFLAEMVTDHPEKANDLDPDLTTSAQDEMDAESDQRVVARFPDEPSTTARSHRNDPQRRKVWLNIEYIRGDFDEDGVVELRRIKRVGNVILENHVVEKTEFVTWSPIRVAHRLIGRSLADTLLDIQKIRSVLTRKAMDSLTQSLAPRTFANGSIISEDPTVLDRIMDHEIGDVIPVNGDPRAVLYTEITPDVSASAFQAIEYWDRRSEEASGVNRHAMGIQPQAITETKGGIDMLQAAANSRVEEVARLAAAGLEQLLTKVLELVVENQDQPRIIKVAGKPLKADPRLWSDEMTVTVDVGMAAESREKKLSYLGVIAGKQEAVLQAAPNNPMVSLKKLRKTYAQMTTVMGFKDPSEFFEEVPDDWQPPQPGKDHKTLEVEQKGQLQAAELQGKQQLAQADQQGRIQMQSAEIAGKQQVAQIELQGKQRMSEMEMQAKAQQAEREAQLQREIAQMKMDLERHIAEQRLAQERELALLRLDQERQMAAMQMAMGGNKTSAPSTPSFRDGGRLDA